VETKTREELDLLHCVSAGFLAAGEEKPGMNIGMWSITDRSRKTAKVSRIPNNLVSVADRYLRGDRFEDQIEPQLPSSSDLRVNREC
jgi:hypothetical protein